MRLTPAQIETFKDTAKAVLGACDGLSFAVLVGSQASGTAHALSDWDIALQWAPTVSAVDPLVATEELRQKLRHALKVSEEQIDLIDLAGARLTMRALVVEEGLPLFIGNELAWVRFMQTTWAELEDHEWRQQHAA
jgi:predicted nucleotidyltransferase